MYKIKYNYTTGDSFQSHDEEDVLEFEWTNLDLAKECLQRIKEHYRWYKSFGDHRMHREKKPWWHNVKGNLHSDDHYLLNVRMDNGEDVQFMAPWCGYFETLHSAEIFEDGNTDMKIIFE
jgi:hypothetical protein